MYSEKQNNAFKEKLIDLDKAVNLVKDGDTVAFGGTVITRTPMKLVWGIMKAKKKHLTIVRTMMSFEGILLAAGGNADKIITSWIAVAGPLGISRSFSELVSSKKIEWEKWSHMGMLLRFIAGAWNVPFLPTHTMLESDMQREVSCKVIDDPFNGKKVLAVPPIVPDVSIVHVQRADVYGNAQVLGMPIQDKEVALSGKTVIITAEEIVSTEELKKCPSYNLIPHFAVDAVVRAPLGAYPTEVQGYYDADIDFLKRFSEIEKKGVTEVERWIAEKFTSVSSFEELISPEIENLKLSMKKIYGGNCL
ncbi:MAG: CoA transferase subunit A [bacterium]